MIGFPFRQFKEIFPKELRKGDKAESDPRSLLFGAVEGQKNVRKFLFRNACAIVADLPLILCSHQ